MTLFEEGFDYHEKDDSDYNDSDDDSEDDTDDSESDTWKKTIGIPSTWNLYCKELSNLASAQ